MRTNIVIDPQLMKAALQASGLTTKKKAVEEGLKLLTAQSGDGGHPAYRGWLARRSRLSAPASPRSALPESARSSDPLKAALDAKYRR